LNSTEVFYFIAMTKTERELQERLKELSCLYEVSSIIVANDTTTVEDTLLKIAISIKHAFQYPELVEVEIHSSDYTLSTNPKHPKSTASLESSFFYTDEKAGKIIVFFTNTSEAHFLKEEQLLIDNIGVKVAQLLEKLEVKRREEVLKRQMERSDRLAILGELTAGIAHELNTPLTNILGYAELLKEESQKQNKDLDKILQSAIYAREVVKKLMFFSCEMPQKKEIIDLVPLLREALELLDPTFRKKEVKYLLSIESSKLLLRADTIQITQIIFNLVINALYFSPPKGLVEVFAREDQDNIIIEIKDEGEGIKKGTEEKIFQPFFTTKKVGEGSGLGLSVVHGIVKSHHGHIVAKNNPLKGAHFQVTLPKG